MSRLASYPLAGCLWQLLDLLHHRGPGVCCGHCRWEAAVLGEWLQLTFARLEWYGDEEGYGLGL